MTSNYHTPHATGEALTAVLQNAPLADLDEAIGLAFGGVLGVRSRGALGNNSHDDTAAIQNTIDEAGVNGHVYLPIGRYPLSGPLVPLSGQTWSGDGWGSVLTRVPGYTGGVITGPHLDDVTLRDFQIDGDRSIAMGSGALIRPFNCSRWRIDRLSVINSHQIGVLFDGGDDNRVTNSHFENVLCGVVGGTWVQGTSFNRNAVIGNSFKNIDLNAIYFVGDRNSSGGGGDGTDIVICYDNIAANNTIVGSGDSAIESGVGCSGTIITGNTIRGGAGAFAGYYGILVRDNQNTIVFGNDVLGVPGLDDTCAGIGIVPFYDASFDIVIGPNVVAGCRIGMTVINCHGLTIDGGSYHNNANEGVRLDDVFDLTITGVSSRSNGLSGFRLYAVTRATWSACSAYDNSASAPGSYDGFAVVDAGATNIAFADCSAYDTRAGGARTQRYGLLAYAGTLIWQDGGRFYNNVTEDIYNNIAGQFHSRVLA